MPPIKGILFDKDGTLLDFNATWLPAMRKAALFVAAGNEPLAEQLMIIGGYNHETQRVRAGSLFAAGNTEEITSAWLAFHPSGEVAELVPHVDQIFQRQGARDCTAVTNLGVVLGRLKQQGLCLGVASSDSLSGIKMTLAPFGVLELFDFIAGYDSGHGVKPGPGMVYGFCAATGLSPDAVLVVGDNQHDLQMGRNACAGLVVGVLSGTSDRTHLAKDADHILDSVADLNALLEKL
jgi:phosphoglycolate phosphatase